MMWLLEGLVNTFNSLVITCGTDDLKCILRQCNLADWKLVVSLVRHYRKFSILGSWLGKRSHYMVQNLF